VLNAHLASFSSFCNCSPTHLTFSHKNQKVLDNMSHIQQHLENKGVDKEQVEQISMDLSPSFIAGVEIHSLPHKLPLIGSMLLNY
jgi:hypothetical protein